MRNVMVGKGVETFTIRHIAVHPRTSPQLMQRALGHEPDKSVEYWLCEEEVTRKKKEECEVFLQMMWRLRK